MKIQTIVSTALFAAISIFSAGIFAADAEKTPAAETVAKVKPHSHMEEKTGVPAQKAQDAAAPAEKSDAADKPKASKKKKHFHPRDGK